MKKLGQLAQQFGDAAQSLETGNSQQTAAQLTDLAGDLEQLALDLSELEMLEDALDQIADAKDSMSCSSCQGMGCSQCQGMGSGMGNNGMGMGEGQGRDARPEEETKTGFYESQVRTKPHGGKGVASGVAFGPNKIDDAREQLKAEILQSQQSNDDPLTGQRLPKAQRDLAREYFDAFREGE